MTEHESTSSPAEDAPRERIAVPVGERSITVGRFRGYTATKIMREAAAIGRRYPKITKQLAAYKREYEQENTLVLERPEAEMKLGDLARNISDKAWEQSGGKVVLRRSPSLEEQVVAVFPDLMEHAEKHVVRILALVAASRAELEEAYDEDKVDDLLDESGKALLFEADAEELLELALAAVEVGRAQFGPLRDRAGKLLALMGLTSTPSKSTDQETTTTPEEAATDEDSSKSPTSSETRASSSIDSETHTDGHPTGSSSESPGSRSGSSASA